MTRTKYFLCCIIIAIYSTCNVICRLSVLRRRQCVTDCCVYDTRADWHKASQALYSFGYVIMLSTLLLAMLHLCCRFCCSRPFSLATVIGSLVVAGCTYLCFSHRCRPIWEVAPLASNNKKLCRKVVLKFLFFHETNYGP